MTLPDAEANLHRMHDMIDRACASTRGDDVEIFHRASMRRRVTLVSQRERHEIQEVMEEGLAVRVRSGDSVGFAAAAGAEPKLAWTLDRARVAATRGTAQAASWERGASALVDRVDPRVPDLAELAGWLEGMGGEAVRANPWVEAAFTVETLGTTDGLRASRSRTRAWAMALLPSTPGGREQPRTLQGGDLADLDPAGWLDELDAPPPIPRAGGPLVFRNEAARVLVQGLAAVLHGPGTTPGTSVGPGWKLRDEPEGTFDDCGFPTRPVLLADGQETLASFDGPGHLRRPSYRDWPEPHPARLTVSVGSAGFPLGATHIADVRIHAAGSGWILLCEGFGTRGGVLRATPAELARAIAGTAGPARAIGPVVTPSLVVEGLALET